MTAASPRSRPAAICARVDRHGLIAAECLSLTGGQPDDDGIAACERIDLVGRAAYVQTGLNVIASASSFDELVSAVAAQDFPAEQFRIDTHDPSGRLDRSTVDVATAQAICELFGSSPFPFTVRDALKEMLAANPTKMSELVTLAAQAGTSVPAELQ